MNAITNNQLNAEDLIHTALSDNKKRWYDLDELAVATGLQVTQILKTIKQSGRFVGAEDTMHMPVYTTRERFRKEEPFINKLIGAFKNRIL
ncbi:MAG: hypothetical protein ABWY16_13060 [Pedobacter sp.]|uniref:hypothetical protein n=1 Tax=Pedobacter sp. TaxID=1411316 RepID=UPI003396DD4C